VYIPFPGCKQSLPGGVGAAAGVSIEGPVIGVGIAAGVRPAIEPCGVCMLPGLAGAGCAEAPATSFGAPILELEPAAGPALGIVAIALWLELPAAPAGFVITDAGVFVSP
jgi:hypothetical protein